ncbi:MAG: SCO family protein [Terriglobales bacterium]|jgi:protein SCO1/2
MNLQRFIPVVCLGILLSGCQSKTKHFDLKGQVLDKKPATNEITVNHEDIPGFMSAMTMSYSVKDKTGFQQVEPGDVIAADVITAKNGNEYWLENIRITDASGRKTIKPATVHRLDIGERVPDLSLVNQDGKSFRLDDFKGKAVLITFIYTRCPMPTFCPRLSNQFAKIQNDLAKTPVDFAKTHLVTISFDPKYDTPPVLRKYGLAYLDNDPAGFSHWDFASAKEGDLRKIADAFGLEYFEEDNQIAHSMVIVLMSPEGTVAKYWSTEWTTVEPEDALRQQEKPGIVPAKADGQRKAG